MPRALPEYEALIKLMEKAYREGKIQISLPFAGAYTLRRKVYQARNRLRTTNTEFSHLDEIGCRLLFGTAAGFTQPATVKLRNGQEKPVDNTVPAILVLQRGDPMLSKVLQSQGILEPPKELQRDDLTDFEKEVIYGVGGQKKDAT